MFVGMPAALMLHEFGSQVWHAFGEPPYLVGSALRGKQWRTRWPSTTAPRSAC